MGEGHDRWPAPRHEHLSSKVADKPFALFLNQKKSRVREWLTEDNVRMVRARTSGRNGRNDFSLTLGTVIPDHAR